MVWNPFRRKQKDEFREAAEQYAEYQLGSAKGDLSPSLRRVALLTTDNRTRDHVSALLTPLAETLHCPLKLKASVASAVNSQVTLFDVQPAVDARLHADYDRTVRMKKSMKKFGQDLLGNLGPRPLAERYRRGTYGTLYYFCYDVENPDEVHADIPSAGLPTIAGPLLFNFHDLPRAIGAFLQSHG